MLKNSLAKLRYKVPTSIYYTICFIGMCITLVVTYLVLSFTLNSRLILDIGQKADTFTSAVAWEYRAFRYDGVDKTGLLAPHTRLVATIEGMTSTGKLLVRYPTNGSFVKNAYLLADLNLTNITKSAQLVNKFKLQTIYLDIYQVPNSSKDVIVAWLENGVPLNLLLINANVALPDENPPTNIVNILMAAYLWQNL